MSLKEKIIDKTKQNKTKKKEKKKGKKKEKKKIHTNK